MLAQYTQETRVTQQNWTFIERAVKSVLPVGGHFKITSVYNDGLEKFKDDYPVRHATNGQREVSQGQGSTPSVRFYKNDAPIIGVNFHEQHANVTSAFLHDIPRDARNNNPSAYEDFSEFWKEQLFDFSQLHIEATGMAMQNLIPIQDAKAKLALTVQRHRYENALTR